MRLAILNLMAISFVVGQYTYDNGTGYHCEPGKAYCAAADIIIRCDGQGIGVPGRCSDSLAGQPPLGVNPAKCWQQDRNSGLAACEKNVGALPITIYLRKEG